jgi:hypothetical protein
VLPSSRPATEQITHDRRFCRTFRDGSDGTRTRDLRRDRPAF